MSSLRFPVLLWEDADGHFTAQTADGTAAAACDPTAEGCLNQLKKYLSWLDQKGEGLVAADFREARLEYFEVIIQPEYSSGDRRYPTDHPLSIKIPTVLGQRRDRSLVCSLPTLGIRFQYHTEQALPRHVQDYAGQELGGKNPQQLSRFLPPRTASVVQIFVSTGRHSQQPPDPELHALSEVAEALGESGSRKRFARAWHRDDEIADVIRRLHEGANILLIGESGVGKTTLLVDVVRQVERSLSPTHDPLAGSAEESEGSRRWTSQDPTPVYRRRFWMTTGQRLIAGMQYLGQWEERCEVVIEDLQRIHGILCIENLLDLIRSADAEPSSSLGAFFAPYLERGELRMVAECSPQELDACRRLLPGLVEQFQVVKVEPFDVPASRLVLARLTEAAVQNYHIQVQDGVQELVLRLFRRFMPYSVFPGKTATFLRELFQQAATSQEPKITTEHVLRLFIAQTGLPELFLRDERTLPHQQVAEAFQKQVIGQVEPCRIAADLVTTFKAGLNDPSRPLGVLLFCGPTGVGKTQLAKTLVNYLFGHGESKDRLVRLDMSEYAGFGAAERMLATPRGEPTDWIRRVRQQPFCVVLFDEVEKAALEVFDALLGLFDEGRLTDRFGRTTVFRSAIIVMTSNLGARANEPVGFDGQQPSYQREALSFFRPEFFNRMDALVTFRPLGSADIRQITEKELAEVAAREGLAKKSLQLTWTDRLAEKLAQVGFDHRYGARPLQRTIERQVVVPVSHWLVEHPDVQGRRLLVDLDSQGQPTITDSPASSS